MVVGGAVAPYFASCVSGLEPVLAAELASPQIGASNVQEGRLGVSFEGPPEVGARAVLWGRTCLRVMELLASDDGVNNAETLYDFARESVAWDELLSGRTETLSVQSVLSASRAAESGRGARPGDWYCGDCGALVFASKDACFKCGARKPLADRDGGNGALTHSHFSSLTIKNAVVDELRDRHGWRPDVDTRDADLPLFLHHHQGSASLYRVLSGAGSMHKRGYRADSAMHVAALRETLAAGMLLHAGYSPDEDVLCDPMTGSGTIAIEAALIATRTPPGLLRPPPALTRWPDASAHRWAELTGEADAHRRPHAPRPILANDYHRGALTLASRAAEAAGVASSISFSEGPAARYSPDHTPDLVVTNPPWDGRLEGGEEAWTELRGFLKGSCGGATAWVLSGNKELTQHLRMRASTKVKIENAGTKLALILLDSSGGPSAEAIEAMSYRELQQACKAIGLPARGKTAGKAMPSADGTVLVDADASGKGEAELEDFFSNLYQ